MGVAGRLAALPVGAQADRRPSRPGSWCLAGQPGHGRARGARAAAGGLRPGRARAADGDRRLGAGCTGATCAGARHAVAALEGFAPSVRSSRRASPPRTTTRRRSWRRSSRWSRQRQIPANAAPLLASALLALEQPARVVQLCLRAVRAGPRDGPRLPDGRARRQREAVPGRRLRGVVRGLPCWASIASAPRCSASTPPAACRSSAGSTTRLAWLGRAVDAGYVDVEVLEKDEDIAPVRALPGFAAVLERARTKSIPPLPATAGRGPG